MMRNNQYWFSTTSPYAPTLNFFLAYEYCRNLGLQLVTLETKEEIDAIALYLTSTEGQLQLLYWRTSALHSILCIHKSFSAFNCLLSRE